MRIPRLPALLVGCLLTSHAFASDEIQVYTNDLRKPGESGVEIHMNHAPVGRADADWPGQVPSRRAFNVTPEFSWGLGGGWDWGIYVPMTLSGERSVFQNGLKLRVKRLFNLDKEGELYWGANFELARNRTSATEQNWTGELRTILGKDFERWKFAANLNFGLEFSGPNRNGTPELALSLRAMRKLSEKWHVGLEHYAEPGRINALQSWGNSGQMTYLVTEYEGGKGWDLHVGVGHDWTGNGDGTVLKAILSLDF